VEMIIDYLKKNVNNAKQILKAAIPLVAQIQTFKAHDALKYALVTDPSVMTPEQMEKYKLLIGKYIHA
ncbi:MAG: S-methyl-5'-thioadenosine phosphorylase, partial [Candidatus Omnitrophica bacterium]|nr:S-methyl-5'-thioadenosine phosphorylase [Candidatus Omnitrophota bacterium]